MEHVLIDCIEPSPREPSAAGPEPPSLGIDAGSVTTRDLLDLLSLASDLAAWTETVDGCELDYGDFEDLEQFGRRAHEILRRLRGGAQPGREIS